MRTAMSVPIIFVCLSSEREKLDNYLAFDLHRCH